ncbi:MAG: FAD-binding oxidoreductase [Microgenomates group bacterium]
MELSKPQKYSARVSDKYFVSDNERFLYVKLELVLPDRISYLAGQYISIQINDLGERRCYSIASTSDDNHGFHLLVEIVGEGKGSNYFHNLQIGQVVEVLAPLGKFVVSENKINKLLFVATGSGIVPIYAMINDLLINKKEARPMRLHWGMKNEEDLFFVDDLNQLSEEHPNFVFDIVLSRPSPEWDLCTGHVQDCLVRDFVEGLTDWEAYVCGKPVVVGEIVKKLTELSMKPENIYHEKFT